MTEGERDEGALLALTLPSRPEAPGAARKALAALNGDLHLISAACLRDAELLVTELVTNAARHGDTETVGLSVRATPDRLRVEVGQAAPAAAARPAAPPVRDQPGGWGLRIVDVLARDWGIEGAVVWFELDRPRSDAPAEATGEALPPPGL